MYKLLKRNSNDRINFEDFSTHEFLSNNKKELNELAVADELSKNFNNELKILDEQTINNNNNNIINNTKNVSATCTNNTNNILINKKNTFKNIQDQKRQIKIKPILQQQQQEDLYQQELGKLIESNFIFFK